MPVFIKSGQTVDVDSGITKGFDDVANAGTFTNAGTVVDITQDALASASGVGQATGTGIKQTRRISLAAGVGQSTGLAKPVEKRIKGASGFGEGLGTATASPQTQSVASGVGQAVGAARTSPIPFPVASGNGQATGTATASPQTQLVASGIGQASGTATQTPVFTSIASGFGEGLGTAGTRFDNITSASGVGQATGTATKQFQRFPVAAGIGQAAGQATTDRFRPIVASGSGSGIGLARNPLPFDAVAQIVNLLNETNDSRWRYGKPERIDPIWEYSHNDRVNFPNPALYVYTPSDASIDKFGIEGESFNQTITIEILVMTLEATETQAYISETAELITQLYDDNTANSNFHRFGNINLADLRNEHVPQQTDHYIGTVTFEIQRFAAIPALQSVGAFR